MNLGSDGRCTGFEWAEWLFQGINACCNIHDLGATDGQLLDCLLGTTPTWAWFFVGLAVAAMILLRPIYNMLQRWGWVK